ncbi:hypothetical protein PHMEG_0004933 [Phytophthora megakarya]|uniref:Reverse transcriptase RNase H-like domain-containing protein n=1 Tax=Phytophthora megakarya TaxID=4795 RepID=A0A225WSQ8_9STRA|nr:hypothetical protein PHMEG_0004933 [Phytophthora megakarya]
MITDHRNLIYIFAPGAEVKKHYKYKIEHIPGDENVWADMLSRWVGEKPTVTRKGETFTAQTTHVT